MTSAFRNSAVRQLVMDLHPGTSLDQGIRDATIIALQSDVPAVLVYQNRRFEINPKEIVKLLAQQSPLITGTHRVTKNT